MRPRSSRLTKKSVLTTLRDMPDTFETEELIERIILLSKIEEGISEARAGRTLTVEEMREHIKSKWSR